MAQGNATRPTLMNLSTSGGLSASSLSGPPIASQPPTVDAGFRQGPGQYQSRPNHPGQGMLLFFNHLDLFTSANSWQIQKDGVHMNPSLPCI